MRLLTTLSSTHWLCTAETVSPIIEKTTLLGKDIILALRTHMRTLGLIYHMHHWTWNWQSQTNLVGAAPFRVLHCGPPPLGPILPFPSVCSESSPSSQNCIRYEYPCCCEKNMVVFFLPKHNGNWLERQEMQISTYLWKTVHLPLWNGFLPPRTRPVQSWTVTNIMLFSVRLLLSQILPRRWGNTKKYVFSVLLTWAWKLLSAVIELK